MKIELKKNNYPVFPQANDIYKVILYVDQKISNYHKTILDSVNFKVVDRQVQYYKSAAEYLGLLYENEPTEIAKHIFQLDKNNLFISIVKLIFSNEIFYVYYTNKNPNYAVAELMKKYNYSLTTANRRLSTIKSWVKWCEIIVKENNIAVEV